MRDALVIGAGMAGLAAARELARAGLSVEALEGRGRVGGRVSSTRASAARRWRRGPTFTIMRRLRKVGPEDLSAREFIERQGNRGRARMLAEMTCTAHLPGTLDQVGLLGLREDGVLTLENGMNYRIAEGYDCLVAHVGRGLEVELGFEVRTLSYGPGGVTATSTDGRERAARAGVCTLPLGVVQSGRVTFAPALPSRSGSP